MHLFLLASTVFLLIGKSYSGIAGIALFIVHLPGYVAINPNKAAAMVLSGASKGTLCRNGFFGVNPFLSGKQIQNFMAEKKAFALRIDADSMKAVEKWAADEFRSTNGQLEWIINKALKDSGRKK